MADDNNNDKDPKKLINSPFLWYLLGAIALAFFFQSAFEGPAAKVSFSYELEPLVNLELIKPEESKKTALNDNLVTFSGQFRDHLTEEGKNRYKYLELLNANEELKGQLTQTEGELKPLKNQVVQAGATFLALSGTPVPPNGYLVIDDVASTLKGDAKVVVNAPQKDVPVSLPQVKEAYAEIQKTSSHEKVDQLLAQTEELVRLFRSPVLGIGNERLKQKLKAYAHDLDDATHNTHLTSDQKLKTIDRTLKGLDEIVVDLNKAEDFTHLSKLRSVRAYSETLEQYNHFLTDLEDNQLQLDKARAIVAPTIWFFNNQQLSTRSLEKQDPEAFHQWFLTAKKEWTQFDENKAKSFKAPDQPLNTVLEKTFKSEEPQPNYLSYFFTLLPVLIVVFFLYFIFSRQMKGVGTSAMNFGKSPARLMTKEKNKVTFKDVAGCDEAIEELEEIVEFLKNPGKFTALGGHIPKGVLCIGPPGTGKTLIAKAVAGEADRPFFSISGSDFVEMFVGVGASRIRDMFDQAKKNAPCIIFMDEIDAVGRHRGAGIGGGHDEREQTLNQLLVEMDGFDTSDGVILMAATNRPDVLDKALLRPGRFDRRVIIGLPDIKGRFEILKVHAKKIKMDPNVDLLSVARATPGCSGADLGNLLNEAALLAARNNRTQVTTREITEARDKVLYGKERRSLEMDVQEKRTTAFHEAGHTIVALSVEHADPVDKVTIIPRGMSLGSTMFLPEKNKVNYWKNELHDRLAVLMGGRGAEEIFVGDVSSGAQQDFRQATGLARAMVCEWGMSDKLGTVSYDDPTDSGQYMGMGGYHEKKYSEATAREIDAEVKEILDAAYKKALTLIEKSRKQVQLMTEMLIEFETLDAEDVKKILNETWSIEEKRQKLKTAEDLHRKEPLANPVPPPPPPIESTKSLLEPG
jgi:cell division protease FtsH